MPDTRNIGAKMETAGGRIAGFGWTRIAATAILAVALVGCGTTHTRTVYVPTTATQAVAEAPSTPQVTAQQLESAAGTKAPHSHLTDLRVAGEWAVATWTGAVPQPEGVLFRETAGKWRVAHAPVVNALPATYVPGMPAAEARVLGITIITPQVEQQERERAKREYAERRSNESSERLERVEGRLRRQHEQTCSRLYREYQEGEPPVGEAGEVAPRSRAAIQEYGRMGCH